MRPLLYAIALSVLLILPACQRTPSADGVVVRKSPHSVENTLDRVAAVAESLGAHVLARIDHAEDAATTGVEMAPAGVVIFSNPSMGTPLIAASPTAGLDLPVRVLVWEDDGNTWLAYTDPEALARRHDIDRDHAAIVRMSTTLDSIVNTVLAEPD